MAYRADASLTVLHGHDTLAMKDLLLWDSAVKNVVEDRTSDEIIFFSATNEKVKGGRNGSKQVSHKQ